MTEFEKLYREYAPDIFRFALYLSGNRAAAEDLVSETFVRAWNSGETVRASSAKAYLFTIARNCFYNQQRRAARQEPMDDTLKDSAATPSVAAERNEEFEHAMLALQQLPELDRDILLLRAQEGLAYEEIAEAVGLSLAAVKVRIHRARKKLLETLKPERNKYEDHEKCA